MTSRLVVVLGALAAITVGEGCSCDTFRFYEVIRTPVDECDILPQGEFCVEPEQLSAPTFEIWAVEHRGDEVRIVVDEEVWIADALTPEQESATPNRVTSSKKEIATVDPGPCTTTTTRTFDLVADPNDGGLDPLTGLDAVRELTGTLNEQTRLTGPEDCGDTPRGLRSVAELAGDLAGAP